MSTLSKDGKALKLKDLCSITSSKRIYAADYVEDGIPFVRGKEVVQRFSGSGSLESELFISPTKFETLRDRFGAPTAGDLLLTSVGTLGVPYLVTAGDEFYFKDGNLTWFRNFDGLNSKFFYYWIQSRAGRAQLAKCTIGTSQAAYTIERLKEIEGPKHSIDQQERIADILSAYDELIENNRRRIALLEEAARMLYREWFVHFRFPGHERVKITDGLPEGWVRRTLVELAEVVMGQSPKSQFYNDVGEGLPFHQGVTDYGSRFVSHRIYSTAVTKIAEAGDTLVSVRAPVGRINITRDKIVLGRGLAAIRSRTEHQSFLFYALKNHFYVEDIIGTGAIYAATNKKELEGQTLLEPPALLLQQFEDQVNTIDLQIACLEDQNDNLARARNLLLPRLMNGEITV